MRRLPLTSIAAGALPAMLLAATVASAATPSGREYERVTPADKNHADVTQAIASPDGDHVQVNALSTAFGDAYGNPLSSFASARGRDGWSTRAVNFATEQPVEVSPILVDATDDLSRRVVFGSVLSTSPPADIADSLWLDGPAGQERIRTQPVTYGDGDLRYAGMSADAGHVLFHTGDRIAPEAAGQLAGRQLYDYTGGRLQIVGVLSDGSLTSACGAVLGNGAGGKDLDPVTFLPGTGGGTIGAVSRDGGTAFFQSPDPRGSGDPSCDDPSRLYVRRGGRTTVEASAPAAGAPADAPADVTFQGAAADGSRVFFTTTQRLVAGLPDNTTQLYAYDVPTGVLRAVSAGPGGTASADVRGSVAFSRDGRVAYFVAGGVLASGAAPGEDNIYRWEDGETAFVATLSPSDGDSFTPNGQPGELQARTSADGRRLVFRSTANLDAGGYDAAGTAQLYLYDRASAAGIRCVSCRADGTPPTASATIAGSTYQAQVPTAVMHPAAGMSDDGSHVFFQSADRVVAGARNGMANVYEWTDAQGASLISSGAGPDDALYVGNSATGRDVFFATAERLVPSDGDGNYDIYDARAGGGFPEPVSQTCDGDACQGAATAIPAPPAPASVAAGRGNVTPAPAGSAPAPRTLQIGSVSAAARARFARTGVLTLRVKVRGGGKVSARATARIRGRTVRVAAGSATARGTASTVSLRLRLSAAARRELRRHGRLRVRTVVSMSRAKTRTSTITLEKTRSPK